MRVSSVKGYDDAYPQVTIDCGSYPNRAALTVTVWGILCEGTVPGAIVTVSVNGAGVSGTETTAADGRITFTVHDVLTDEQAVTITAQTPDRRFSRAKAFTLTRGRVRHFSVCLGGFDLQLAGVQFSLFAIDALNNYDADWRATAAGVKAYKNLPPYPRHWTAAASAPVLYPKDEELRVTAFFSFYGMTDDATVQVFWEGSDVAAGTADCSFYAMKVNEPAEFEVGIRLPAAGKVARVLKGLVWVVTTRQSGTYRFESGPHELLFTIAEPRIVSKELSTPTIKRMRAAIELVAAADSDDPFAVMEQLMGRFPNYVLVRDNAVPAKYDHPRFRSFYQAWPLCDPGIAAKGGECQAIVSHCTTVMEMVGMPGTFERTYVCALPEAPFTVVDVVDENVTLKAKDYAPYSLVDCVGGSLTDLVQDEEIFFNSPFPAQCGKIITLRSNNYEACLRLTWQGKRRWYGGGAGTYKSAELVLFDFSGLIRYRIDGDNMLFDGIVGLYDQNVRTAARRRAEIE